MEAIGHDPAAPAAAPAAAGGTTSLVRALVAAFAFGVPIDALWIFESGVVRAAFAAVPVVAATLHVISTRNLRAPSFPGLLLTAFTTWSAVTLLWVHDLATAQERLVTYVQLLVALWLVWQTIEERRDVRAMLAGYTAGCAAVVIAVWQAFLSGVTYTQQAAKFQDLRTEDQRFAALGFDPNDMGITLAIGIPMAAYLALHGTGRLRYLWLCYVPAALSGIALSGSRGAAMTAAVATAAVLWWLTRRSVAVGVAALVLGLAGGAIAWWSTPDSWERILSVRQQIAGGTLGERLPIWRAGLDVFLHDPVAGVGVGGFPDAVVPGLGYGIVAHNTLLSVAVEGGTIGLLLFVGAFAAVAARVLDGRRAERALALALLLVWFVGTSSLSWEYRKTTWFLVLLGAAIAAPSTSEAPREEGT